MDHIWTIEQWEKYIDITEEGHRIGLRVIFDQNIDVEVRSECKAFAKFLRKEYFFPIRVRVYIKNVARIKCRDGDWAYGTCWQPNEYKEEPYIRVAAGDYSDLCERWGKDDALAAILLTIAHELTHYFQWINNLQLTSIGMERQATKYAKFILDEYREIEKSL